MKSNNDIMIKMSQVDICFYIQENGFISFKDFLLNIGKYKFLQKKFVLRDINIEIKKGESIALLGKNGSGKSTLLRAMSGIIEPEKGKIEVNGIIAPLLGLGVGLEYEMSGIENIQLSCALMGLSKAETRKLMPEIIEFSELDEAIHWPVKRYSTGMMSRLAFSIAIMKQPEILLIDEVLSVGDIGFQQKCLRKVEEIKNNGATIVFVSHNFKEVQKMCTKGALVNNGSIEFYGDINEAGARYDQLFNN
ncbi:MAG: ABC transporter ATP-binding protein [Bacteroidota bacterium]|nr:ABC transporter ATP-binding protein [Bacteroidota bacterium]